MKGNIRLALIILSTFVVGVLSMIIVTKVSQLGTKPVAPSAPESKPKAEETIPNNITPAAGCKLPFVVPTISITLSPTPTGTRIPTPTSTPTQTPSPTGRPTVTSSPTPTNTPVSGQSYCDYLTADKTSGSLPLTVNLKGKGFDTNGIKAFRFTFGDGEKKEISGSFTPSHIEEIAHTYSRAGQYSAMLEILGNGDHWKTADDCKLTITVSGLAVGPTNTPRPTILAEKPTKVPTQPVPTEEQLPEAGIKIPTLTGIIIGFLLISLGVALVF